MKTFAIIVALVIVAGAAPTRGLKLAGEGEVFQGLQCLKEMRNTSALFGTRAVGDMLVSHVPFWEAAGSSIADLSLHYNASSGCVSGVGASYGKDGQTPRSAYEVLGSGEGSSTTKPPTHASLKLGANELIKRVDVKAGKCVEWLRVVTSANRTLALGNAASKAPLKTSTPPQSAKAGFLSAFKGYVSAGGSGDGAHPKQLRALQLVWSACTGGRRYEFVVHDATDNNVVALVKSQWAALGAAKQQLLGSWPSVTINKPAAALPPAPLSDELLPPLDSGSEPSKLPLLPSLLPPLPSLLPPLPQLKPLLPLPPLPAELQAALAPVLAAAAVVVTAPLAVVTAPLALAGGVVMANAMACDSETSELCMMVHPDIWLHAKMSEALHLP